MRFDYFGITQHAQKQYAQAMEPICTVWNLTKNELDVLLFLYNNPEFDRAADIVAHRGMAKSHVSLSVTSLQGKGLLLRREDPEDRRTVHLKLSEEARSIAEQGRQVQKQFFGRLFQGVSREELQLWQGILDKVCANVEQMRQG